MHRYTVYSRLYTYFQTKQWSYDMVYIKDTSFLVQIRKDPKRVLPRIYPPGNIPPEEKRKVIFPATFLKGDMWSFPGEYVVIINGMTFILLLMVQKSGVHQLRLVVYPIIYRVLAPSQVVRDFFHKQYHQHGTTHCWWNSNQLIDPLRYFWSWSWARGGWINNWLAVGLTAGVRNFVVFFLGHYLFGQPFFWSLKKLRSHEKQ